MALHGNPAFRAYLGSLRAELGRVGPPQAGTRRDFFLRAVSLKRAFLDAAYRDGP